MAIIVKNSQFHLVTKNTSYIMSVYKNKWLTHLYWGKRLDANVDLEYFNDEFIFSRANAFHVPVDTDNRIFVSDLQFEFSTVGSGDYRTPSVQIKHADGSTVSDFKYISYGVYDGKNKLDGLPMTYYEQGDKTQTLEIVLKDAYAGINAVLLYTVFEDYDVITRSIRYENTSSAEVELLCAYSTTIDLRKTEQKVLDLYGDWARERNVEWKEVGHSRTSFDSKRGMSSHFHNPFIAVADKNADEYTGDVYGFSLVYSGSFEAFAEGNPCGGTRVGIGINPFNFNWSLKAGESFSTPEVVMVYSDCGLNNLSLIYHRIFRERLCCRNFRNTVRPLIINNWEGTAFNFDEEKLIDIAKVGSELGLELFVLDDGWFGKRNSDNCSLGDWTVNKDKLPGGLAGVAEKVKALGMKFGIWLEPEMVSPDSELYREHPDWCIYAAGRKRTENRYQLVLDLTKSEVKEYVYRSVANVLSSADISYVKWDCNRNITETQNMEQQHRYVLGLYEILQRLNDEFPNVLFEGCSGGGGRFDSGMLYYMPQTWTSDNTNPMSRLRIQYGTSVVYPAITMSAHVGSIEVGKNEENKYLNTCALVAMSGNFGYELDLSKMSDVEIRQARVYVDLYKKIRETVQFGNMYRLENPFESDFASFEYVNSDKSQAVVFTYQMFNELNGSERKVFLKGLDSNGVYDVNGKRYAGYALMSQGFKIELNTYNYHSNCFVFERLD